MAKSCAGVDFLCGCSGGKDKLLLLVLVLFLVLSLVLVVVLEVMGIVVVVVVVIAVVDCCIGLVYMTLNGFSFVGCLCLTL